MSKRGDTRIIRHRRIRAVLSGTAARPRLAVFRSNYALYAQVIDDDAQKTLFASFVKGASVARAKELGTAIAELAKKHKVKTMVFDRGGYQYHGTIRAIADATREGGVTI
jgi:large subunit ribosomal protein L18